MTPLGNPFGKFRAWCKSPFTSLRFTINIDLTMTSCFGDVIIAQQSHAMVFSYFCRTYYTLPGQQDIPASGNTLYLNEETL